jgi:RNA polymerase sigma factor (sigma-70 family)
VTAPAAPGHERLLKELAPRVLGTLVRRHGDFETCEDAVQEALLAAARTWPRDGTPDDPGAWLARVASRRAIDVFRRDSARRRREAAVAVAADEAVPPREPGGPEEDDALVLLFMACHPALTPPSAIALTLRAVGALTTAQIASAFFVPEATLGQRIHRAKRTIQASGARFEMPTGSERERRLGTVLHVLYLMFNEGYTASSGPELQRVELADEAIRLTRMLHAGLPEAPEAAGLLALMLLTHARRRARTGPRGELVPLQGQDRSLWDRGEIEEGVALVSATLPKGSIGPYQLQAAIAALHDEAPRPGDTDWPQILALYGVYRRISDHPMVALNHAIATAMVHGPERGLELLDALEGDRHLAAGHRLDAVRAHLLEMAGDRAAALERYRRAAARATNLPERNYLLARAAELAEGPAGTGGGSG